MTASSAAAPVIPPLRLSGLEPLVIDEQTLFVNVGEWWKAGFVMSVVLIIIWLLVGGVWWKVLGYW